MALIADLVHQTTASSGTGDLTLIAANGKQTFADAFGTGGTDRFYYFVSSQSAVEWEVGTGHMSDATTLVRDTVLASSNGGAAVNFAAGLKDVACDLPAAMQASRTSVDALFFDNRVQGMHLAEAMAQPMFLGPDGSALHDGFDTLDYVDVAAASNLDTSESGCLTPASWSNTFTGALGSTTPNFPNAAFRQRIESSAISASGNLVRVTLSAPSDASCEVTHVFIGHAASASAFDGTQVRVTFGGSNGATIPMGGSVTSDAISYALDEAKPVIVAMDLGDGSQAYDVAAPASQTLYYKATAAEASQTNPSGYTAAANRLYVLSKIEVGTAGAALEVDVASDPVTAAETPDTMRAALRMYDAAGITLNTDTTIQLSRDGGTTWATATLVERYTQPGDVRVLDTGDVDVSGQPSGTFLRWRWQTFNGVAPKLLSVAMWASKP